MQTQLKLRLSPTLKAAIELAAASQGIAPHAWSLQALDATAGIGPAIDRSPYRRIALLPGEARLSLKLSPPRRKAYESAAFAAALPLTDWARAVLGVAAGISALDDQLSQLSSGI